MSASTARAACTTESFDFNDGTMQGWDTHGGYTTVNTGSSIYVSGHGHGLNGINYDFAGGDSVHISYDWSASSGWYYTTTQRIDLYDADTGVSLYGHYTICASCEISASSGSGTYSNTFTTEVSGVSNLHVKIGLYDSWTTDWGNTNRLDNIVIEVCTADEDEDGYTEEDGDCDDRDASVYPGADEVCDGADNDCDGETDESDALDPATWYLDGDGDGYGDADSTTEACDAPTGYVADDTDCNDGDAAISPAAVEACDGIDNDCDGETDESDASDVIDWYLDLDGDGYGDPSESVYRCEMPAGYVGDSTDCDDSDAMVSPSGVELCDGFDNDCDGSTDEDDAADVSTWYADADGDGYGIPGVSTDRCYAPTGYVSEPTDCNDADSAISPLATEVCDEIDNDCDGFTDEGVETTWYADSDGDGHGDLSSSIDACTPMIGYVMDATDCNDTDGTISPLATELCDGLDNDCDGSTDEDDAADVSTWYADEDGDGSGDAASWFESCEPPSGYIADDGDCNDSDAAIHPSAAEVCDEIDNDCDGDIDSDDSSISDAVAWYVDADGDGYGNADYAVETCERPPGYTADSSDCDDGSAASHPGAYEICDGMDNDCDGSSDEDDAIDASVWYADADGDGYGDATVTDESCEAPGGFVADATDCADDDAGAHPDSDEVPYDGVDQDCDGVDLCDVDGDGYDAEACGTGGDEDCDDEDDTVYPGAPELADGVDNDCNGLSEDDDTDGDGLADESELLIGTDPSNPDSDEDGLADGQEITVPSDPEDTDDDGLIDALDEDDDGDGLWTFDELDGYDWAESSSDESPPDTDDDGTPNHLDTDSDDDGTPDSEEGMGDQDCDGIANYIDADDDTDACDTGYIGDTGDIGDIGDTGDTGFVSDADTDDTDSDEDDSDTDTVKDTVKDESKSSGCASAQNVGQLESKFWLFILAPLALWRRQRT